MRRKRPDGQVWESVTADRRPLLLLAFAVLAAGVTFAAVRGSGTEPAAGGGDQAAGVLEVETEQPGEVRPAGEEPVGTARRIPSAPVPPRADAHAVWSGREVLVWSGAVRTFEGEDSGTQTAAGGAGGTGFEPVEGGAAFDPEADAWRVLPEAPIAPRVGAAAVWAGDRLVVWGGFAGPDEPAGDGAAYLPDEDRWIPLPDSPLSPRGDMVAAWTGREVLLVGGAERAGRPWGQSSGVQRDGAAFDPGTGTWRPLPPVPDGVWPVWQQFVGAWADGFLVVWGRDVAVYDPGVDAWDRVPAPASSLWPGARVQAVALDGDVAVLGIALRDNPDTLGFVYSPDGDAFAPIPRLTPRSAMTSDSRAAGVGDGLVVLPSTPPSAAAWQPGAGAWDALPADLGERTGAAVVHTGAELVVWGGWDGQSPRADGLVWTP